MSNIPIEPRWITGREAMSRWSGFSKRKLSELMSRGLLPHKRRGNTVKFNVAQCGSVIDRLHEQGE
jgi:hypothetical protein